MIYSHGTVMINTKWYKIPPYTTPDVWLAITTCFEAIGCIVWSEIKADYESVYSLQPARCCFIVALQLICFVTMILTMFILCSENMYISTIFMEVFSTTHDGYSNDGFKICSV